MKGLNMKDCGPSTLQPRANKLEKDFKEAKRALATELAKYKVSQRIKHNNWPDSAYRYGIIESIFLDYLDEWKICYWVDYKDGRCGRVYEEEIVDGKW